MPQPGRGGAFPVVAPVPGIPAVPARAAVVVVVTVMGVLVLVLLVVVIVPIPLHGIPPWHIDPIAATAVIHPLTSCDVLASTPGERFRGVDAPQGSARRGCLYAPSA